MILVPNVEAGCCLGTEGNGISAGEGGEGRPSPPGGGKDKEAGKISNQCPTKAGTTCARMRKTNLVGRDDGGSA